MVRLSDPMITKSGSRTPTMVVMVGDVTACTCVASRAVGPVRSAGFWSLVTSVISAEVRASVAPVVVHVEVRRMWWCVNEGVLPPLDGRLSLADFYFSSPYFRRRGDGT